VEFAADKVNKQAHYLLRSVARAIREYDMLREGDRVAVAVSGGKDSLALLELLDRYRQTAAVRYDLCVIHVLGDATGIVAPHAPLAAWLDARGLPYRLVTPTLAAGDSLPLDCQRCAWLRRKALFSAADEIGCNVLAYAHHADDVAQTTLLNLLYGGSVKSLAPAASYFRGRFRLVRPLAYTPERDLARFARAAGFPPPPPSCPRGDISRRKTAREMLRLLGPDYARQARGNLLRLGLQSATSSEFSVTSEANVEGSTVG
jgi:tRNA 2-thiocytidine biosynthesis protein TtcA